MEGEFSQMSKTCMGRGLLYSDISGLKNLNAAGTQTAKQRAWFNLEAGPYDVQNFTLNQCKAVEGEEHREMSASERSEEEKLVSRQDKRCEEKEVSALCLVVKTGWVLTPVLSRDWMKILCRVGVRQG